MMNARTICVLFACTTQLLAIVGCERSTPQPTLIVHFHDGVYDLINHDEKVIATAKNLDEFEALSKTNAVKSLIRGNGIVARCEGVSTPDGISSPTEVDLLLGRLVHADVYRIAFEYTNYPD